MLCITACITNIQLVISMRCWKIETRMKVGGVNYILSLPLLFFFCGGGFLFINPLVRFYLSALLLNISFLPSFGQKLERSTMKFYEQPGQDLPRDAAHQAGWLCLCSSYPAGSRIPSKSTSSPSLWVKCKLAVQDQFCCASFIGNTSDFIQPSCSCLTLS